MIRKQPDTGELGRGRSGVVLRSVDAAGRPIARKVFGGDRATKLVHYVIFGAPNPYVWSEPAIRSAVLRRKIMEALLPLWFGSTLRVARAYGHALNATFRANEMTCELIEGRHAALHHPFSDPQDCELSELRALMKPLQRRLIESGFDGLVWQAGRGNPVALNNFMRDAAGWVWIDLESGVPALIPINPLDLLGFYLPKSIRHRTPLFDDVDVPKLKHYVDTNRSALSGLHPPEVLQQLAADVEELGEQQHRWKSLARHRRSIAYRRLKGDITEAQAAWYDGRPLHWYAREAWACALTAGATVLAAARWLVRSVAALEVRRILKNCWLMLTSQEYRDQLARNYVSHRIAAWRQRRQLSDNEAAVLQDDLEAQGASSYLTDFGVHVAIKPLVKTLQWWVGLTLTAFGVINLTVWMILVATGGAVARTLYTLWRIVQNTRRGRERPWIALIVGMLPVVGNLAFPLQIVFSSAHEQAKAAQFILYDTFSRFGQLFPIWGGSDTLTEHLSNHCPDVLVRYRTATPAATR